MAGRFGPMAEATLRTLFERLGRPPTEADIRIARAGVDAPMPWYVQVMVGIGAWLAALAIIVAVVLVLTETLGIDDPEAAMAAVGGILFAIGLFAGRGGSGVFRQQFAVALALGGLLVAVVGLAVMVERFEVAAAGSVLATVVVVALRRAGAKTLSKHTKKQELTMLKKRVPADFVTHKMLHSVARAD